MLVLNQSIVIDTSVAIKWISQENELLLSQANLVLTDIRDNELEIFMPELTKYEVGNALRFKKISPQEVIRSITAFYNIPVSFFSDNQETAIQTMKLAQEIDVTYYDASFIVLAKNLNAPLITANPKHHAKYKEGDVTIIPLEQYK